MSIKNVFDNIIKCIMAICLILIVGCITHDPRSVDTSENNEHHEQIKIVNVKHVVFHNVKKYSFFVINRDGYEEPLTIIFKDNPKIKRDVNDDEMCWVDYGKWQDHNYVIDNMSIHDFGFNAVIHLHQDTEMTAGENSYRIDKNIYTEQPKFME